MSVFAPLQILASALLVGLLPSTSLFAAEKPSTITVDWATYNPVSMLLKDKGLLEKEFAKDGISIRWVQSAGSNKALEFLNAGSIDFGSTAGSAALVAKINGNPIKSIYVYSRPEWTAWLQARTARSLRCRSQGQTCGCYAGHRPAHLSRARAAERWPFRKRHPTGAAAACRRKIALIRGDVDAWAGLDPMMAQAEVEDGAKLFYRNAAANTWGILNVLRTSRKNIPIWSNACSPRTRRRANIR